MTDRRAMRLLGDRPCFVCGVVVRAGATVWWDVLHSSPVCAPCHEGPKIEARVEGVAGASAAREYERRSNRRTLQVRKAHPRVGGALLAISNEPQRVKAWSTGASGERIVGAALDALVDRECIVLHDRRIPGSKANIDHLVVSRTAVFVINAKKWSGRLERRDRGGPFRHDVRLFVGGRDRTKAAEASLREGSLVRGRLGGPWDGTPVVPVLCFTGVEVGLFTRPFVIGGVHVTWPRAIGKLVCGPATLDSAQVNGIARTLQEAFPPAVKTS